MFNYWIWIFFPLLVVIVQQKQARKRRQMGPRLKVDNETFLKVVAEKPEKVIRGPKVMLQGYTYLVRGDDYYYYTVSKEPLRLPDGVDVTEVSQILL